MQLFALMVAVVSLFSSVIADSYTQILLNAYPNANYSLPPLPYATGDLEPFIDNATVNVHYNGHQRTYTNNMNNILAGWRSMDTSGLSNQSLVQIFANIDSVPTAYRQKLINMGGGYVNHMLYWYCMSANPSNVSRPPNGSLASDINAAFGSYQNFVVQFNAAASALFGSGYVFLVRNMTGGLQIISTANQDLIFEQSVCQGPSNGICAPILTLDVWEHAYYLKNQNLRMNYVSAWWILVDWNRVAELDAAFRSANVPHSSATGSSTYADEL